MEYLLSPDTGLIVWTLVTFLALVFLLGRFAWRPILTALEERETRLRQETEVAQKAREAAEGLRSQYEQQLALIRAEAEKLMVQARTRGEELQANIVKEAQKQANLLMEKTKEQLELEKERLMNDMRSQVGTLSAMAAERLMRRSVDQKVHEKLLEEFFADLGESRG